jgi:hypothetical protein
VVRDSRRGLSRIHVARNVSAQVPKLSSALPYAYVKGCKTELEKNNNNDNQQEKISKYEVVARMRKSGERVSRRAIRAPLTRLSGRPLRLPNFAGDKGDPTARGAVLTCMGNF